MILSTSGGPVVALVDVVVSVNSTKLWFLWVRTVSSDKLKTLTGTCCDGHPMASVQHPTRPWEAGNRSVTSTTPVYVLSGRRPGQ